MFEILGEVRVLRTDDGNRGRNAVILLARELAVAFEISQRRAERLDELWAETTSECIRADDRANKAEAAIARVRELVGAWQGAEHMTYRMLARDVLEALDGMPASTRQDSVSCCDEIKKP